MDHRRGDWDGAIAPPPHDADERSLGFAVDDRTMHEERLEFFRLRRDINQDQHSVVPDVDPRWQGKDVPGKER